MVQDTKVLRTDEEIKIFADPYRNRIIKAFLESATPLTVTQVANIMGEVPANVHYHLKKLLKINVLELHHIEVVKGINAKYYQLAYENFKLSTSSEEVNETKVDKQFARIKELIFSEIDEFRKEVSIMPKFDPNAEEPRGIFGRRDIYLSTEEFSKLNKIITKFMAEKMVKDDTKNKYSVLLGAFIKEEGDSK